MVPELPRGPPRGMVPVSSAEPPAPMELVPDRPFELEAEPSPDMLEQAVSKPARPTVNINFNIL